ncbi:hypothetical protein [Paenibacillus planticolens]|uniref:Uncharacterized protein n=1 Tax=Paenibacillus planticolens TaxID=2654976 RepID=A0ABX1ZNY3_9BACL|nr:hypothetical protein [Paenibacillus planticolens]NOV01526.1 hypothetical protein [Paenibacillus planticolens]
MLDNQCSSFEEILSALKYAKQIGARERARSIVTSVTGVPYAEADRILKETNEQFNLAII